MTDEGGIHFRILEDIARDLSGDVNFPTCLDAAILVRNTLKNPDISIEQVVRVVGSEPLIATKLLRLANSVSHNPGGEAIADLGLAISRLGFDSVRTTALAVSMEQMLRSRHLVAYDRISRQTWAHSIEVATIARVLARHHRQVAPDAAMLAGLVHQVGIFYLLYRAAEYPQYRDDEPAMIELLKGWHEGVGDSLLHILGVPGVIVDTIRDLSHRQATFPPATIGDVLHLAIQLADGTTMAWLDKPLAYHSVSAEEQAGYAAILQQARDDMVDLRVALAA